MTILMFSPKPTYLTGFGTVARNLISRMDLNEKIVVVSGGTSWQDGVIEFDKYTQISVSNIDGLKYALVKLRPKLLITHGSYAHFKAIHPMIKQLKIKCPKIAMSVVENPPASKEWVEMINEYDHLVTASKYSEKIFCDSGVTIDTTVIRHGVDTNVFKPVNMEKHFDCIYVGDNNVRKMLPLLIQSLTKMQDVNLLLITDALGRFKSRLGENLIPIAEYYNVEDRVKFHPAAGIYPVPDTELVKYYNMSRIYVNTSAGEAFGLPILEAAACGIPTVTSECVGVKEYLDDAIEYAKTQTKIWFQWGEFSIVDIDDFVNKVLKLLHDEDYYKKKSKKCIQYASKLTWDQPALQLQSLIEQYL